MLSSPRTNGAANLFNSNHHLTLITQPILAARSRKKNPITNNQRISFNDSPSIILPVNRGDKSQHEKKNIHHEPSDSGIDLSLSTYSSVQYPHQQQHSILHRPLSALNEHGNTNDATQDQSIRIPVIHLGRNRSIETIISNNIQEQQHRTSSFSDEREKLNHNGAHLDTFKELHQQTNTNKSESLHPSTQQHRSLNDLTNKSLPTVYTTIRKVNVSPVRKKTKLNIIVEQSIPLSSSRLASNDEQIYSVTRITSSSTNQKTKPKALTPLGHYPNQEQMRAHINRSVIERQHPSYLPIPPRRDLTQKIIPLDAASSKGNHLLSRQQKQSTTNLHSNPSGFGVSTTQNSHIAPSRQPKHTLPVLYNEESIDDHQEKRNQREKRRLNEITKYSKNSQKEQVQIKVKDIQDPLKVHRKHESSQPQLEQTIDQHHVIISNKRHQEKEISFDKNQKKRIKQDLIENFLTSTPRRYYEIGSDYNNNRHIVNNTDDKHKYNQANKTTLSRLNNKNLNRQQQFTDPTHGSKQNGYVTRNKNRVINPNTELESEYFHRNTTTHFQSRSTKQLCIPKIQTQTEQNHQLKQTKKSPDGSTNNLLRTTPIQTTNTNNNRQGREVNRLNNKSKISSTQKESNRFFQTRSPSPLSILSDHQVDQQIYDSDKSPSPPSSPRHELINNQSNLTYRLLSTNQQQPLHTTFIIPTDNNFQFPSLIDPTSQTSSHQEYYFTCTTASDNIDEDIIDNSSRQSSASNTVDDQSCSSSTYDRLTPNNRSPSPLEKVIISKKEDDISTNYDSDDGWSDDSAEVIYIDEHYLTQKKKIISSSSSSSYLVSQQHSHLKTQQQNVLLQ